MEQPVSELRKKPHTHIQPRRPVLLTMQYPQYVEYLIEYAVNAEIILCCRIDISVNGIQISEDFRLTPAQITAIWQEKPKTTTINIELPEHLTGSEINTIETKVGINGLYINSLEADSLLSSMETRRFLSQENKTPFREDAISNAVINHILPALFPNKALSLSTTEINQLKFKCFEELKPTLEKDGHVISYKKIGKKDTFFIVIKQQGNSPSIRTTFEAFRKRFDALFKIYLNG